MSANLLVDVGNTCLFVPSISVVASASAIASGAFNTSGSLAVGVSGAASVGQWVDLSNSDTYCNVYVMCGPCSGPLQVAIQTAEGPFDIPFGNAFSGNIFSGGAPLSGSFTDPTSGLAQLPTWLNSGGVLLVNSGLSIVPGQMGASGQPVGGYLQGSLPFGPNPIFHGQNGAAFVGSGAIPEFASGGIAFAAFQRNYQYARLVLLSGATQVNYLQAGFLANFMTTGSGGGYSQQPFPTNQVTV